jgi:hypothetical protein
VADPLDDGLPDSGLTPRDSAAVFEFGGRLWMSDGYKPGNIQTDDMLVSANGYRWERINADLPYAKFSPIGVHDGKIWVVDDLVRHTIDGVNYSTVPSTNVPPLAIESPIVSLGGKMHFIGRVGFAYSSADGTSWVHSRLPWGDRKGDAFAFYNGRIYAMGGAEWRVNSPPERGYPDMTSLNEVWSTDDPENPEAWVNHGQAPWTPRMWPGLGVHDGHLYLFGGYDNFNNDAPESYNFSDTWRMDESGAWERLELTASIPDGRHAPSLYSRNGRLMLACGNSNRNGSVRSDVWELRSV